MNQLFRGWFDDRNLPVTDRVRQALAFYQKKYGVPPTLVLLPLNEEEVEELGIVVEKDKYVLPNCMLLGVNNERINDNEQ